MNATCASPSEDPISMADGAADQENVIFVARVIGRA